MLDLIIRGGQVVTPQVVAEMDVGVQGEKIAAFGQPGTLASASARVIDARGKIVLPGGIEPHAHVGIPVPPDWTGQADVMTQPPEAASRETGYSVEFFDMLGNTVAVATVPGSVLRAPTHADRPAVRSESISV